jgi:hypothetical protein
MEVALSVQMYDNLKGYNKKLLFSLFPTNILDKLMLQNTLTRISIANCLSLLSFLEDAFSPVVLVLLYF